MVKPRLLSIRDSMKQRRLGLARATQAPGLKGLTVKKWLRIVATFIVFRRPLCPSVFVSQDAPCFRNPIGGFVVLLIGLIQATLPSQADIYKKLDVILSWLIFELFCNWSLFGHLFPHDNYSMTSYALNFSLARKE